MIDRVALDRELEHLLGRPLGKPVRFDTTMNLATPAARSWLATLRVLDEDAVGLTTHPLTACHLQNLVIAGLLLAQPHNYSEALHEPSRPAPSRAIRRAADLLETEPERPWSSTTLAHEVALSVRALQEGFQRAFERPPMTYLREVRLNRVHEALTAAAPDATTVSTIAARWGFHHPGRFAAAYRKKFGRVRGAPQTALPRHQPDSTGRCFGSISDSPGPRGRTGVLGTFEGDSGRRAPGRRGSSRLHNREGDEAGHDTLRKLREQRPRASQPHLRGT
jgi:AraC-like DNA-binding protein